MKIDAKKICEKVLENPNEFNHVLKNDAFTKSMDALISYDVLFSMQRHCKDLLDILEKLEDVFLMDDEEITLRYEVIRCLSDFKTVLDTSLNEIID